MIGGSLLLLFLFASNEQPMENLETKYVCVPTQDADNKFIRTLFTLLFCTFLILIVRFFVESPEHQEHYERLMDREHPVKVRYFAIRKEYGGEQHDADYKLTLLRK